MNHIPKSGNNNKGVLPLVLLHYVAQLDGAVVTPVSGVLGSVLVLRVFSQIKGDHIESHQLVGPHYVFNIIRWIRVGTAQGHRGSFNGADVAPGVGHVMELGIRDSCDTTCRLYELL